MQILFVIDFTTNFFNVLLTLVLGPPIHTNERNAYFYYITDILNYNIYIDYYSKFKM